MHKLHNEFDNIRPITSSDSPQFVAGSRGETVEGGGGEKNFTTDSSPFEHQLGRGDRLVGRNVVMLVRGGTPGGGLIVKRVNDGIHIRLDWNNVQNMLNCGDLKLVRD
jgi:hypothetical protein